MKKGSGTTFLLFEISKEIHFESAVSKLVIKLVRHDDQEEREADGWCSGNRWVRSCDTHFREKTDTLVLISTGSSTTTKEAARPGSNFAKLSRRSIEHYALFRDTLVGNVFAPVSINFARAQEKGLQFWQARSLTKIVHSQLH